MMQAMFPLLCFFIFMHYLNKFMMVIWDEKLDKSARMGGSKTAIFDSLICPLSDMLRECFDGLIHTQNSMSFFVG